MIPKLLRNFHFAATAILALGLVPAFHFAHLPLRFTWKSYFVIYWWSLAFQSMAVAIVFYAIGFPAEFWKKLTGPSTSKQGPREALLALLVPAAYFFVFFILVFSYNDVIAMLRFRGSADTVLNRMDSWVLGGASVLSLAHRVSPHTLSIMNTIYYMLFSQIGACLILLALRCGRDTAMRYIATIATVYYIGLVIFYFVPATGPYYLLAMNGDAHYVSPFVQTLNAMRDHHPPNIIGADYYIALPCLHIAQPLIALWFVRQWKPIAFLLSAYCAVLVPSILYLEQHYVVDLIGGVLVAIVAIAMVSEHESRTSTVAVSASAVSSSQTREL